MLQSPNPRSQKNHPLPTPPPAPNIPNFRVRYQTLEIGGEDIHIRTLRDRQQFADEDGEAEALGISSANWPLFGVIWDSSQILAHLMADYDIEGLRILELGCGMALSSLVLNKRMADITATDYHPEAEDFLRQNAELNNDRVIPFIRTGWTDENNSHNSGLGYFDLILGSDLLYEAGHVEQLSAFINRHAQQTCKVILVDPGRGHHARFSRQMVSLGFTHSQHKPESTPYLNQPFKGQILHYSR